MADDKRAEAMRLAVEESNKTHGKASDTKKSRFHNSDAKVASDSNGQTGSKFNVKSLVSNPGDHIGHLKDKFLELWSNKIGRLAIIVAGSVLFLIIVVSVFSKGSTKLQEAPAQYEITDAVLCVYEADNAAGYAYDAYVEITNTGSSNLYATDIQFTIRDNDGSRIMIDKNIRTFPVIVAPGEKGYLFNQFGTELTGVYEPDLELSLVPEFKVLKSAQLPYNYPVGNVTVGYGVAGQRLVCQLKNDTPDMASSIYCVALTYDPDGRCTGISGTSLTNVEAHEIVNVQFNPLTMIRPWKNSKIADYVVHAY